MKDFFARPLGFGRYPDLTVGQVYARDRQYFDQILYKNHKFRHEYAQAYASWLEKTIPGLGNMANALLLARILASIDIVGEKETQKLFNKVAEVAGHKGEPIPYKNTFPGATFSQDPANADLMKVLIRFWQRFALPEVREE